MPDELENAIAGFKQFLAFKDEIGPMLQLVREVAPMLQQVRAQGAAVVQDVQRAVTDPAVQAGITKIAQSIGDIVARLEKLEAFVPQLEKVLPELEAIMADMAKAK